MQSDRQAIITLACIVAGLVCAMAFIVWPQYRAARNLSRQGDLLVHRIANGAQEHQALEDATTELVALRRRIEHDLRGIPDEPDMKSLYGALTRPVDGRDVIDQTFNTGRPGPALGDEGCAVSALPLTVDLIGTFAAVFAQIEAAESMDRLVRVTSVRAERHEEFDHLVTATIGLEAIFEPSEIAAPAEGE